ncbi:hypothetical protein GCM10012288_22120 [Malaciobacter pacificus]|uniref:Uncharacterized protein n=1 Tax=Malaciobacter pacificus TaxID=1080223 RepID=A0A5C2HBZ6_9BACT|nr:hypothetical protein [Malaciobacter pacificus]QEP34736.1 hypothetical protein APAC_1640 [Malaciobacter pacificus]GGD47485.1 hypothetical protein GCM10012288_22120 [Malaciobacter pacificus]
MVKIIELNKLKNLTKNENNVLIELIEQADEKNNIFLDTEKRDIIAQSLDISRNGLVKAILSLEKSKELLSKKNEYHYILNKEVFSKVAS